MDCHVATQGALIARVVIGREMLAVVRVIVPAVVVAQACLSVGSSPS